MKAKIFLVILVLSVFSCATKKEYSALESSPVQVISTVKLEKVNIESPEINLKKLYEIKGSYPLGDIVFINENTVVVPYAKIRKLTEEEKKEYIEKRKEYLKKSPEELTKEVVKKEKGESETSYKLRKELTKWFFKIAKGNPNLFFKPPEEVATELGIQIVELGENGYRVLKAVPIITEEIPTGTQCGVQSGSHLIKKPVKVCRNWLRLDTSIVYDGRFLYVTPSYSFKKGIPTVVVDLEKFEVKGYLNDVRVLSKLKGNLLYAYLTDENTGAIGYVKKTSGGFKFFPERKIKFKYGKSILIGDRFLVSLTFPSIYDLEKNKTIKAFYQGITEFKGDVLYIRAGIVKRTSKDFSRLKEKYILCSTLTGDISPFCYIHRPFENYVLFLHDRGVPARNPQTGKIYGSGSTYRAEVWALNPYKKSKFKLLDEEVEYHFHHFEFISYNPQSKILVIRNSRKNLAVYKPVW